MTTEIARAAGQHAEELFASGFYCAESSLLALARAQDMASEQLPAIATAFCSGLARTCGTCGALSGAIMGISLGLGRKTPQDSVQPAYAATQALIRSFETEFGSANCQTLLGCDLATPEGQTTFREQQLGKRCAQYTRRATEIAAEILQGRKPEHMPEA